MPRKTELDKAIEKNEQEIKNLTAINDALRTIRDDAKQKKGKE